MALNYADAYAQIKLLENNGLLSLPETQETIEIGTIDPVAGTFTWSVPTVVQTSVIPPLPDPAPQGLGPTLGGGDPTTPFIADPGWAGIGGFGPHGVPPVGFPPVNQIINIEVGVVATKAVDLRLRFAVIPQNKPVVAQPISVTPSPVSASGSAPGPHAPAATAKISSAAKETLIGGLIAGETNGGVTISGYPTVESRANEITIDVGLDGSPALRTPHITPPVGRLGATINIPGHDSIELSFFVLRPPVVGMGAFTIPALPMTIVYAPPQGKEHKNFATYSDTETLTRTVTSAVTTSTVTKTVEAYSPADLMSQALEAVTAAIAVVGSGGSDVAADASILGGLAQIGTALVGKVKDDNDSIAAATKQIADEAKAVGDILKGIDASTSSMDATLTTSETDHSLTIVQSNMSQYQSATGLGPGVGDRIVYLRDLKVVWVAVNGEVGIAVIGYQGSGSNAVIDLVKERDRLKAGQAATLGFDLDTINVLLAQDPMAPREGRVLTTAAVPPAVITPPRFVAADPPERSGTSTGPGGDQFSVTYDSTVEDTQVTTSSHAHITDSKPGWLAVIFGADDVETNTTTTFTTTRTVDTKDEVKLTSTVTYFSDGLDDEYDAKNFYDYTFGTYAYVPPHSPFLGLSVVNSSLDAGDVTV